MKIEKKAVEYFIEGYLECFMYSFCYRQEDIDEIMISFSKWIDARQGNYQSNEAQQYVEALKEKIFYDNSDTLRNALVKLLQNHFPEENNPENKLDEIVELIKIKVESRGKNNQNLKTVN